MKTARISFEAWMKQVDLACGAFCGMSIHDLPDCPFRDWYEDEDTPKQAARRAIRMAKDDDFG